MYKLGKSTSLHALMCFTGEVPGLITGALSKCALWRAHVAVVVLFCSRSTCSERGSFIFSLRSASYGYRRIFPWSLFSSYFRQVLAAFSIRSCSMMNDTLGFHVRSASCVQRRLGAK